MAALSIAFEAPDNAGGMSHSGERPIDLVHLARQTMGDKALELEVLHTFARQARSYMSDLSCGQADVVSQTAHKLKGAALAIGDPMALKSEHAQLLEQRDALERQYAAIALAIETLGRADAELQSRFSPQLAQKAADYMDYLTDGRYDELVLARDLSAKARSIDDPTPRDTAYLSAGTADLLYLSVRLALCELTCPADDPCPLVLDDTLVNFDDARAGRAMALFREIAQHRQVILFTCHERDCPAQA